MIVATVIDPQAFLVRRIGADRIRVEVLVPAGKEPEHYQATPEKIAALSRSRALFRTGMPFEETLLPKLQSLTEDLNVVDLREGIVLRTLELHDHDGEETSNTGHRHHAGCSHDGLDPHIWFAPDPLKIQAGTILKTLIGIDPEGADVYRRHYEELLEEIERTRKTLAETLAPYRGKTVFVFHPSYGYFCDEFGLKQRAIEFEGKSPKAQQIAALAGEVGASSGKTDKRPVIFVQPEFNRAPAEALSETVGARLVEHSCLEPDVLQSMIRFAEEVAGTVK